MALTGTDWQVVSGDWDDLADWTNGVPISELDAVFFTAAGTQMNVTGGGLAASITILENSRVLGSHLPATSRRLQLRLPARRSSWAVRPG